MVKSKILGDINGDGKVDILDAGDYDAHTGHGLTINSNANNAYTSMYMGADDAVDSAYIQSAARNTSYTSKNLLLNPNGGKVGIGTASPTHTLQVDASGGANFAVTRTGVADMVYIEADGTNGVIRQPGDGALVFQMGGTSEKMRIGNTGKTSWSAGGIGATSTQSRDFTFYTEGVTNGVAVHSNDHRLIFMGGAGSSGAGMDTGYFQIENAGTAVVALNSNGNSYINGGNVGIGTTAPAVKIHASQTYATPTNGISADTVGIFSKNDTANGNANISVLSRSSGTASLYLGDESDENKWAVSSLTSNSGLTFNYAGAERFRIAGAGHFTFTGKDANSNQIIMKDSGGATDGTLYAEA